MKRPYSFRRSGPALCRPPGAARAGLLVLGLLALGCGKSPDDSRDGTAAGIAAPHKKVFAYARLQSHKNLDPQKQLDGASSDIVGNVYDGLLQYSYLQRPFQLEPNLLSRMPELSADGLRYSFELRPDAYFNDDACFAGGKGRALTSDDVIYSLQRFADANVNVLSYSLLEGVIQGMDEFRQQTRRQGKATDYAKLPIAGIVKRDDRHFTIELTRTNPLALQPLAASPLSIVPREAVVHYGAEFEQHPVGSGPFRVKTMSRRGVIVLAKNPRYHQTYPTAGAPGDAELGLLRAAGQRLPLLDEVQLPLVEEAQPRMLKFLDRQLDMVSFDRDNFSNMAVKDDKGFRLKPEFAAKYRIFAEPAPWLEGLRLNFKDPLLGKNKALRQALAYALDSAGFVEQMYNGRGTPLQTLVPLPIAGSERDVPFEGFVFDAELVRKKLAEAGYPDGKGLPPLTIEYRAATTQSRQNFEFNRAQLAQFGIVVKANFQSFSAWLQRTEAGNYQLCDSAWVADYPDAENFYALLYSKNKPPGPNSGSYENPAYDRLFETIRSMPDGPERHALFARMNAIVKDDAPMIQLWNPTRVGLTQPRVANFKFNPMSEASFKYLDVDPKTKAE
jgi:oligopeptide transport system substrate-binding protein